MREYNLSVVEFAQPSPLVGSIDTYSGFGVASKLAMKVHQEVQLQHSRDNPHYLPEVLVEHVFEFKRMTFKIAGRMDGLFNQPILRIEEIKSRYTCSC